MTPKSIEISDELYGILKERKGKSESFSKYIHRIVKKTEKEFGKALKPTKYSCPECKKEFKSQMSLDQHLTSPKHSKNKFKCEICKGIFKSRESRRLHYQSKHGISFAPIKNIKNPRTLVDTNKLEPVVAQNTEKRVNIQGTISKKEFELRKKCGHVSKEHVDKIVRLI